MTGNGLIGPRAEAGRAPVGSAPSDAVGSPLARPESLNRYAYVVDSPATFPDPSGNFVDESADCLDNPFLAECQCDPINGCPPDLLILAPTLEAVYLGDELKQVLKQFADPLYCVGHTDDLKHCGLCCDAANAAHGLVCTSLLLLPPPDGEALFELWQHLAIEWGKDCAVACLGK